MLAIPREKRRRLEYDDRPVGRRGRTIGTDVQGMPESPIKVGTVSRWLPPKSTRRSTRRLLSTMNIPASPGTPQSTCWIDL